MFDILKSIFGIGEKALEKVFPDRARAREAQAKINEAEICGAPPSRLRLWRSFLGWALSLAFVWEAIARPIIVTYWPQVVLPPSAIREISSLLLGMLGSLLGLGF